jgi:diguanylate cyclase (GGDEF)-like protein
MVIAEPIVTGDHKLLGVLVAKLNFKTVGIILRNYGLEETGELYVVTQEGTLLTSTRPLSSGFMRKRLARPFAKRLYSNEAVAVDYRNYVGTDVVGTLKRVPELDWGVVAEKEISKAYAQIFKLRNMTVGFVAALLFVIGLCAYLLGLTIVRPLNRLITGAGNVASGDLDVDLPVNGRGELGFMTKVFNHMVARLRQGRDELAKMNQTLRDRNQELHELSITDSLTGLFNRKHLMETLTTEVNRSARYERPFAVLMIDIDHFKQYNDTFGHPAGDEVLKKMADIFGNTLRGSDYAARYGGEEFLIMLPESGTENGMDAGERLRNRVAEESFHSDGRDFAITISVGVAICPEHGDKPETLISAADTALYKAKEAGRDRVVLSTKTAEKPTRKPKVQILRKA